MSDPAGETMAAFWVRARCHDPALPSCPPPAWSFGAGPDEADALLALVLQGRKTATASALADYENAGERPPRPGELSVVLDGDGMPRAVIEVTAVDVVPFSEVSAEHAWAEGEGDRSLGHWRDEHRAFWTEHGATGFAPEMPVVCERFRLRFSG